MVSFCPERSGGTDENRAWQAGKTAVRPSFFKKFLKSWLGQNLLNCSALP
jgi:hypothetical protein